MWWSETTTVQTPYYEGITGSNGLMIVLKRVCSVSYSTVPCNRFELWLPLLTHFPLLDWRLICDFFSSPNRRPAFAALQDSLTSTLLCWLFSSLHQWTLDQATVVLRLQLSLWPHQRQSVHTSTSFPPSFLSILALRCYSYRLLLLIRSLLITAAIFPRGYRSSVLGTPYDNHPFAAHNSTASPSIQTTNSLRLFLFLSDLVTSSGQ